MAPSANGTMPAKPNESLLNSIMSKVSRQESKQSLDAFLFDVFKKDWAAAQQENSTTAALFEQEELAFREQKRCIATTTTTTTNTTNTTNTANTATATNTASDTATNTATNTNTNTATNTNTDRCTECGNADAAKFAPSDDKRFLVCQMCGAASRHANFKSHTYESTTRCTTVAADATHLNDGAAALASTAKIVSGALRLDGVSTSNDHAKRRRARDAHIDHTSAPGPHRAAHDRLCREATRESIRDDTGLTQGQIQTHDKIIVEIHSVFASVGIDTDASPLFDATCKRFEGLYTKGATHLSLCASDRCQAAFLRRSVKVVARECIRQVVDVVSAGSAGGQTTFGMAPIVSKKTVCKLAANIAPYTAHNSSNAVKLEFQKLFDTSATDLALPCAPPSPVATASATASATSSAIVLAPDPPSVAAYSLAARRPALSNALKAASKLGLCTAEVVDECTKSLMRPTFYQWIEETWAWDIDLLALALLYKAIEHRHPMALKQAMMRTALKKRVDGNTLKTMLQSIPFAAADGGAGAGGAGAWD